MTGRPSRLLRATAVVTTLAAAGCSAMESYSVRMAERSCDALNVCTVYGPEGAHLSPCIATNGGAIYPGDARWPYTTPGVCDTVRDGRVVSSREGQ